MTNRSPTRRLALAALLFCAAALGGCGNVTVGGVGQAEVYMSGDASQPATAGRSAQTSDEGGPVGAPAGAPASAALVGSLEGELQVTATAFSLRRADGSLEVLTPVTSIVVTLDLQGVQEPRVVAEPVPAGAYESVTLYFEDVTAEVTGGLEIGGVPFTGTVAVDLAGPLEVTEALPFVVEDGETVAFLVDLDADAWIALLDALTGTVSAEDFAAAVTVRER